MKNLFQSLSFTLQKRNQTVFIIGGGEVHSSISHYIKWVENLDINEDQTSDWKKYLAKKLPYSGFNVVRIQMPDKTNAYYEAWKAMFEKYHIRQRDIVIGHSLGASFLYKYYQEKPRMPDVHLVAIANLDREDWEVKPHTNDFHFYHSQNDEICPIHTVQPFFENTKGEVQIFENRGHFLQAEFPELLMKLKSTKP
jgi:predicted alpha/beta hydrolase family esterase